MGSIEFIHGRIVEARDNGAAVLLISAELDEIMSLSDRIAVLADQHIIACGPLAEVRRLPHRFVQNFFGGDRALRAFDGVAIV